MKLPRSGPSRNLPQKLLLGLLGSGCFAAGLSAQSSVNSPPLLSYPGGDDVNWQEVLELQRGFWSEPTAPVEVEGLSLPWSRSRAVILVLPLSEIVQETGMRRIFRELLANLLPHGTVVALYHERDQRLLGDWLGLMETDPELAPHLERLELLSSEAFSIWARDFSPIFARGKDGRLVAVDPSFLAVRRLSDLFQNAKAQVDPLEQSYALSDATKELQGMRGSDQVPSLITSLMEGRWRQSTALVRPPLYLLGGDFLPVTSQAALVSTLTLAENGGRAAQLESLFKEYFGVEQLVWLEGLPGDSIEHLDFLVHPIAEKTILVAAPAKLLEDDRPFHRWVDRELRGRLERNRAALAEAFPDHRLIDVPMPPPILDDSQAVADELFDLVVTRIATSRGFPAWPHQGGNDEKYENIDSRLREALWQEAGIRDPRVPTARARAVETYFGRPLEELQQRHVEEHLIFRSYLNSLYVDFGDNQKLVLLPRYRPVRPAEAELLSDLEKQVAMAYREALPDAEIVWIDCTELAEYLGAIHCLTATIPTGGQ
jgi:agmatine/peptidylarginine deiminase